MAFPTEGGGEEVFDAATAEAMIPQPEMGFPFIPADRRFETDFHDNAGIGLLGAVGPRAVADRDGFSTRGKFIHRLTQISQIMGKENFPRYLIGWQVIVELQLQLPAEFIGCSVNAKQGFENP